MGHLLPGIPHSRASWFIWITVNIGPTELLNIKANLTEQSLKTAWRKSIATCTKKRPVLFQTIRNKFLKGTQEQMSRMSDQYF